MRSEFTVHILNDDGLKAATDIAAAFSNLLEEMDRLMPGSSREKALVVTKLQEACFFAKRAIALLPENHK